MATRTISLFAGCGTLDVAVRLALPDARTVCYVETELAACRILAARIAEGSLDDAPIWSNVRTFDTGPWGRVTFLSPATVRHQKGSVMNTIPTPRDGEGIDCDRSRTVRL